MKAIWSKLPSRWIADRQLRAFRAGPVGHQAAALKIYMALALFANFRATPAAEAGSARLSFSELEALCDISRRYVALGLEVLQTHALLTTHPVGNAHRYVLANYDLPGWGNLPRAHLLAEHRFRGLGIRGAQSLHALKLYLALTTFRPNSAQHVLLSYDKIEEYTGIARPRIRHAIDVLLNHDWISIAAQPAAPQDHKKPTNIYILRGDFWGRPQQTYARAAMPANSHV